MAEKFSLVAQIRLQAPTNTRQVVDRIRRDLSGVSVQVHAKGAAKTAKEVAQVNKQLKNASKSATTFATNLKIATQRAAGLALATRAVSALTTRIKAAVDEAISFQRELVKVSQVTGKTLNELKGLTKEITNLSTTLGVSSSSLISVSRQLSQAGFQAADLQVALSALAKTALAPTFDDISRTAEGAIAIFNQFGKGAAALEGQLGAINAIAGQFAVESGDLIGVVQRVGGVFRSAGGSLNELLALFTSVRATTRESSESIATGLRTIFTRIQRPRTIAFLKNLGVELTNAEGRFVGPTKAVEALNKAFADLPQGDLQFVRIAEELGGFRQIGKVIPLIQQFAVAQEALKVAQTGQDSLAKDAATAQQALGVQIEKVRQEYLALIREFTDSSSFKLVVGLALNFASALAKVLSALNDILPLLATLGVASFAGRGGLGGLLGGLRGGLKRNQGGPIGFARGGVVPGTGNRDTVPAMLTPGEFVIKKSSVGKIGSGTLAQMNENRYAKGGIVINRGAIGGFFLRPEQGERDLSVNTSIGVQNPRALRLLGKGPKNQAALRKQALTSGTRGAQQRLLFGRKGIAQGKKLNSKLSDSQFTKSNTLKKKIGEPDADLALQDPRVARRIDRSISSGAAKVNPVSTSLRGVIKGFFPGGGDLKKNAGVAQVVKRETRKGLFRAVEGAAEPINRILDVIPTIDFNAQKVKQAGRTIARDRNASATTEGFIFEGIIQGITGAKLAGNTSNFDFPSSSIGRSKKTLANLFSSGNEGINSLIKADAKRTNSPAALASIIKKITNDINKNQLQGLKFANSGGGISGSDTVPAMLTPGEFVINKKAASNIGSSNLNRMNKQGVVGFNKGGPVGFEAGGVVTQGRHNYGLLPPGVTNVRDLPSSTSTSTSTSSKDTGPSKNSSEKATNRLLALSLAAGSLATASNFARENLGEYGDAVGDSVDASIKLTTSLVAASAVANTMGKFKPLGLAIAGAVIAFQAVNAVAGIFAKSFQRSADAAAKLGDVEGAVAAQRQADAATNRGVKGGTILGSIAGGIGVGAAAGLAGGIFAPITVTAGAIGGGIIGAIGGVVGSTFVGDADNTAEIAQKGIGANLAELDKDFDRFSKGSRSAAATIQQTNAILARARSNQKKFITDEDTAAKLKAEISKQELRLAVDVIGPTAESMKQLRAQTANMTKANQEAAIAAFKVAAAQRELIKINLDAARIGGATVRAGTAVENVVARFQAGSSSLEAAFKTLETSTSTFGKSIDGENALNEIKADINSRLDRIGVTGSARGVIDRSIDSSRAGAQFSARLSERIAGAQLTRGQTKKNEIEAIVTTITGEIENEFTGGGGANLTKTINGSLESVIKEATVNGTVDESKVVEGLAKAANAAGKPLRILGEAFIKHEKLINKLTAQRRAQEQKLVAAQSKAIDLQLEGAKVIQQAGGRRLSFQDQLGARANQANLRLRDAGIGGLGGTGTGNIIGASRRLANRNAQLNQKVTGGGRVSVDAARGPAISKANDALIQFTRQRIKLIQEEMNIIKQKNALERSAIDALLSGDAEAFFEQQSASAAASALKSGNTALIRSLDASAVGAGLKSLQDQGASSTELFSAARTAGLSQQQARIFSGTTPEENSLRRELMASGRTLGALGNTGSELEASNLGVATQIITEANNAFAETLKKELNSANDTQNQVTERNIKATDNLTQQLKDTSEQVSRLSDAIEGSPNEITSTINVNSAGGANDSLMSHLPGVLAENLKKLLPNITHDNNGNHQLNTPKNTPSTSGPGIMGAGSNY